MSLDSTAIKLFPNGFVYNKNSGGDKDSRMHNYLNYYEEILKKYENKDFNFLEVGIFYGHSLITFFNYYKKINIYGIDINLKPFDEFSKKYPEFYNKFKKNIFEFDSISKNDIDKNFKDVKFDVILDDGTHWYKYIINTFENLFFDYLNDGGIYIIEDIHNDGVINYFKDKCEIITGYDKEYPKNEKFSLNKSSIHYNYRRQHKNKYYKNIFSIEFMRRRIIIKKVDSVYYH